MGSIFISNKVFDSLKNQMFLIRDFNTGQYKTKVSELIAMDLSIPNVTVTTIPMNDIKARYLLNAKKYDRCIKTLFIKTIMQIHFYFIKNLLL